ncbi:MAG: helix-turn-helix transcriptional regulator [Clostridia bacterium]|nr:helix-turn-helix transcriptional regulator [Clostridia bacterium]
MFYSNLISLCNEHKTTPTAVCHAIGLAGSAATKWKSGAVPRDPTLRKIADHFGVSVEQLTGKPDKYTHLEVGEISFDLGLFGDVQDPYTPEEQLLIQHWRSHPEAQPFVRKLLDMPEPEAKDTDVVS